MCTAEVCIAQPLLESNTELATAGYFQLKWKLPDEKERKVEVFTLQTSANPDFSTATRTIYQGPDSSSVISGLADGTYYYRVSDSFSGQNSPVLKVEVKHHSISRALIFFGLGTLMFVFTVVVLLKGSSKEA